MEKWLHINGFVGLYQISNTGKVKNTKTGKILGEDPQGTTAKYNSVGLRKNGESFSFYVHRLVASHFIRPPMEGEEVNHIDYNTFNNHVDNLEWVTSKQNSIHSRDNMSKAKRGEKHPRAKVTDQQAIEIKKLRRGGMKYREIASIYGLTINDIGNITTRYYCHLNKLI